MLSATRELVESWALISDEDVVGRVLAGDKGLFEILMRRYNTRLYRAVRGIVRNEAEVEDVLQQTYVNAYGHLTQFDGRAMFSTWLTRIAVHEALARARRSGTIPPPRPRRWHVCGIDDGSAGDAGSRKACAVV